MSEPSVPEVPTPEFVLACINEAKSKILAGDLESVFRIARLMRECYEQILKARHRNGVLTVSTLEEVKVAVEKLEKVVVNIRNAGLRMPDGTLLMPPP
jgi:hypothetical protein